MATFMDVQGKRQAQMYEEMEKKQQEQQQQQQQLPPQQAHAAALEQQQLDQIEQASAILAAKTDKQNSNAEPQSEPAKS